MEENYSEGQDEQKIMEIFLVGTNVSKMSSYANPGILLFLKLEHFKDYTTVTLFLKYKALIMRIHNKYYNMDIKHFKYRHILSSCLYYPTTFNIFKDFH